MSGGALMAAADQQLLAPAGLSVSDLERTLNRLMHRGVDSGELYFEYTRHENWILEDGKVRGGCHNIERGAGIRAMSGSRTGFAYSDEIQEAALLQAADTARAIARGGQDGAMQAWRSHAPAPLYPDLDPLLAHSAADKAALLERLDREARAMDTHVRQVMIGLTGSHRTVLTAGSDGTLAADVRPLVRLNVHVIAERDGRRESGGAGGGWRGDYGAFLEPGGIASRFVREAVQRALTNLDARPAPAGTMTVVLGPGWPGILLHEAVGHGLEGDFNRKGTSAFCGRIGERVADRQVTVVDDGTLPGRRGSLTTDDEGTPSQCTVLIENGILKGYMQDKLNAQLMNSAPTGNGRRESYAHLPMPRMTNTYMRAGHHAPEEIIASVERGIYATQFNGGQVDITNGEFVFSAGSAWLIEHGKLTCPLRGATLIGAGPTALTRISMVGNDLALDEGIGTCGKDGQCVPVGVGQPTLRIDELTVGGTTG